MADTGEGLDDLKHRIASEASRRSLPMSVLVPFSRGELVKLAHEHAEVVDEEPTAEGWRMELRVPTSLEERFAPFSRAADPDGEEPATGA